MSDNIEKALYLGVALMMFIAAITSFFYYYAQYEGFINQGQKRMSSNEMVNQRKDEAFFIISGEEVLHQILEMRKQDKADDIKSQYYDALSALRPKIFVNGEAHDRVDISNINLFQQYHIDYEISAEGVTTAIYYTSE